MGLFVVPTVLRQTLGETLHSISQFCPGAPIFVFANVDKFNETSNQLFDGVHFRYSESKLDNYESIFQALPIAANDFPSDSYYLVGDDDKLSNSRFPPKPAIPGENSIVLFGGTNMQSLSALVEPVAEDTVITNLDDF